MKKVMALLTLIVLLGCENFSTFTTEETAAISVAPPSSQPIKPMPITKPMVDNRYELAERYLSNEDLVFCQIIMEQWDLNNRKLPSEQPPGELRPDGGDPWSEECPLITDNPADLARCMALRDNMGMTMYHSGRYVCAPCGPAPSPENHVFTPEFVEDARTSLDPLFHRDGRGNSLGKVTLIEIFERASQLRRNYPAAYRAPGAAGMWAAAMVIGYDRGAFDAHDQGCQGGNCTDDSSAERFGLLGGGLATGAWATMCAPILATGPPGWVIGTLAVGGYFVVAGSYEAGERVYYRYCSGEGGEYDSEEEFYDDFPTPYNIEDVDPLNYDYFMTSPDWRMP